MASVLLDETAFLCPHAETSGDGGLEVLGGLEMSAVWPEAFERMVHRNDNALGSILSHEQIEGRSELAARAVFATLVEAGVRFPISHPPLTVDQHENTEPAKVNGGRFSAIGVGHGFDVLVVVHEVGVDLAVDELAEPTDVFASLVVMVPGEKERSSTATHEFTNRIHMRSDVALDRRSVLVSLAGHPTGAGVVPSEDDNRRPWIGRYQSLLEST